MASFLGSAVSFLELHYDPVLDELDGEDSDSDLEIDEQDNKRTLTLDEVGFSWGPRGGLVVHAEDRSVKPIFKKSRMPAGVKIGELNENECGICLGELSSSAQFTLACQHTYCQDCLSYYLHQLSGDHRNIFHVRSALETTQHDQHFLRIKKTCGLACPHPSCGHIIEGTEFKEAANEKTWERFCRISLSVNLGHLIQQGQLTLCGRKCPGYIQNCKCSEQECLNKVQRRRSNTEQSLNHRWAVETGIAMCPQCRSLVERNGGCDHMTCRCKRHFSYSANKYSEISRRKKRNLMNHK